MKDNFEASNKLNVQQIVSTITSLTVLLSAIFVLGALCRFFKQCWKKVRRKRQKKHDVIAFQPIVTAPVLRKSSSTSDLERLWRPFVLQDDGIPCDTEEVPVQPELGEVGATSVTPDSSQRQRKAVGLSKSMPPLLQSRRSLESRLDVASHFDPRLYKREASLTRHHTRQKRKCGTINIEIYFNAPLSKLEVKIISINQMVIKGSIPEANTYVTVKKLPDKQIQRTSVHTHSINPEFNSLFTFPVEKDDDVNSYVLIFEVYHMDRFSTSYPRGKAELPLFQVDTSTRRMLAIPSVEPQRSSLTSFHPTYRLSVTGTLLVTMEYKPEKNLIIVNPVKIYNVPKKKHGGYDKSVYIKVVLRNRGTKIMKVKTQPREMKQMLRTTKFYEATFDEPLQLNVESMPVDESDITISLNHYMFLKSSFIIGQIRVSHTEPGYEATHLQAIIDCPDEQISAWYDMKGFTMFTSPE